jgi:hypothetical protein
MGPTVNFLSIQGPWHNLQQAQGLRLKFADLSNSKLFLNDKTCGMATRTLSDSKLFLNGKTRGSTSRYSVRLFGLASCGSSG